ncbi:MAG: hypothetical protein ACK55X_07460 [Synechococcaceae cyanobacterium]
MSATNAVVVPAALLLAMVAATPARALMVYTASGSPISGSLAGNAFSNASWRLSATAEEGLSTNSVFPVPPLGSFDLWWLQANPRLTIETPGQSLEADLLPSSPFAWRILSGLFPVGPSPKIGFVFTTPSFFPETAAGVFGVSDSYTDLRQPLSVVGPSIFEAGSYPTTLGLLVVSEPAIPGTGRFRIDPAPAPLPLFGAGAALAWSRRLRRRAGLHGPVRRSASVATVR